VAAAILLKPSYSTDAYCGLLSTAFRFVDTATAGRGTARRASTASGVYNMLEAIVIPPLSQLLRTAAMASTCSRTAARNLLPAS
jgi:hypothetical protein